MIGLHGPEVHHGHVVVGQEGEQRGEMPDLHHRGSEPLRVPGNAGVCLLVSVQAGRELGLETWQLVQEERGQGSLDKVLGSLL